MVNMLNIPSSGTEEVIIRTEKFTRDPSSSRLRLAEQTNNTIIGRNKNFTLDFEPTYSETGNLWATVRHLQLN